jgi:hypothetical protein
MCAVRLCLAALMAARGLDKLPLHLKRPHLRGRRDRQGRSTGRDTPALWAILTEGVDFQNSQLTVEAEVPKSIGRLESVDAHCTDTDFHPPRTNERRDRLGRITRRRVYPDHRAARVVAESSAALWAATARWRG